MLDGDFKCWPHCVFGFECICRGSMDCKKTLQFIKNTRLFFVLAVDQLKFGLPLRKVTEPCTYLVSQGILPQRQRPQTVFF